MVMCQSDNRKKLVVPSERFMNDLVDLNLLSIRGNGGVFGFGRGRIRFIVVLRKTMNDAVVLVLTLAYML